MARSEDDGLGVRPFLFAAGVIAVLLAALPWACAAQRSGQVPPRASASGTGRIEGRITLSPALSTDRMRFRPYGDFGRGQFPTERNEPANPFARVVVYSVSSTLSGYQAQEQRPPTSISQSNEAFYPRLRPVLRGTTVEFPNDDDIFHNVFSLSGPASFDLGRYPRGESRSVVFDDVGVVAVFCDIHSDMRATVLVLDNPFFAQPDAEGRFFIEGLPPGDHVLAFWHERIKPIELAASVAAGQTTQLSIELPRPSEQMTRPGSLWDRH